MSSDGVGGGIWTNASSFITSSGTRTAVVAVCATAVLAITLRSSSSTTRKGPKVPEKDDQDELQRQQQLRYQRQVQRESDHQTRSRSQSRSYSSSSLSESKNSVAIFWDVDNCAPPTGASGHSVAQAIRRAAQAGAKEITRSENSNVSIVSFKAYLELTTEGSQPSAARVQLHSELQGSGVSLIDTPKSGRKDVADKMMITDLLSFAIDKRPPALIVLLSGDRDFAYPLGILRNRGYEILLVVPPVGATPILEASANHVMRWRQDVLAIERDAHGRLYDKAARDFENSGGRVVAVKEADVAKLSKNVKTVAQINASQVEQASTLKGPGAPPVPTIFNSLVRVLEQMRKEGNSRPLRSKCAPRLQALDSEVYKKAGAMSWGDFIAVAEAAEIVTLGEGPKPGMEWIALRSIDDVPAATTSTSNVFKETTKATLPAASTGGSSDLVVFHPLIEVYKSIKAGLPKTEYPTVAQMTAQLMRMTEVGLRDAYSQAKVNNFTDYMKLAEEAKVGRMAPSESDPSVTIVQIHPKYASLHTGLITPSSSEAKMIDTSKTPIAPPSSSKAGVLASFLPFGKKSKEGKETKDVVAAKNGIDVSSSTTSPQKTTEKSSNEKNSSTLYHPHLPSGEKIHVSYFPLANLLLTQRSEGKMTSLDQFVQTILVKHPKITHLVSSNENFAAYVARAERDKIITIEGKGATRSLRLEPRLCAGEGENRHRGHGGADSGLKRTDSQPFLSSKKEAAAEEEEENNGEEKKNPLERPTLPSFAIEVATPQERIKFKPLIDILVSLRRESPMENLEPLRSRVSSHLVMNTPIDGKMLSPGAWIQMQGYSSFVEFYQAAQRKGFIHLIENDAASKDRIRLAEKYEAMFFPDA